MPNTGIQLTGEGWAMGGARKSFPGSGGSRVQQGSPCVLGESTFSHKEEKE